MQKDDLKLLAEIAILGSNNAQTQDAQTIIDALALCCPENEIAISTQALNQINQGKFDLAEATLVPWCNSNGISVAHSLLAMTYWQWGKLNDAERYCRQVLTANTDEPANDLARQIVAQMGVTI